MRIDTYGQAISFLLACGLGGILCALYGASALIRKIFSFNIAVCWVTYILYFIFALIGALFFFFVVTDGMVRIYLIAGIVLGWIVVYASAKMIIMKHGPKA